MNAIVKHEGVTAPAHFTEEQIQTIKNMYCKGATDDEFKVFLYTCERTGLCPFSKQIYAIKRKAKKPDGTFGEIMTIQTSIDGYRLVAERTGRYCPGQKPTFEYDKNGKLLAATAYVKKLTKDGTWHVVEAEAAFEEYVQAYNGKPSGLWEKMPRVMISKCAEALAIRKCFPAELSGVYTKEEMEQAEVEVVDANSSKILDATVSKMEHVKPIEYITEAEANEIRALVVQCDPMKQQAICEFLTKKCNGEDIVKLKRECFPKIRDLLITRRNEYQDSLLEKPTSMDEVADAE